jgi:hypothetical protein
MNRRMRRPAFVPVPTIVEETYPAHGPDWVESFAAEIMRHVLAYRGDYGGQLVPAYCREIERELERFRAKGLDAGAMKAIEAMGRRAIERAKSNGITAYFEPGE